MNFIAVFWWVINNISLVIELLNAVIALTKEIEIIVKPKSPKVA